MHGTIPALSALAAQGAAEVPDAGLGVLGALCLALAGLFQLSSVGQERARYRTTLILSTRVTSLKPLRSAMHAKARGQAASALLVLGGLCLAASWVVHLRLAMTWVGAIAGILVLASVGFSILLEQHVRAAMRRYLLDHLRQHPFSFEDNIALTREIGELFGVRGGAEDTLESYVAKLRQRLGLPEPSPRSFRRRVPPATG